MNEPEQPEQPEQPESDAVPVKDDKLDNQLGTSTYLLKSMSGAFLKYHAMIVQKLKFYILNCLDKKSDFDSPSSGQKPRGNEEDDEGVFLHFY